MINLWDGSVFTLQKNNISNWQSLANLNQRLVTTNNPFIEIDRINFNLAIFDKLNREFRNTFIKNAQIAIDFLENGCDQCNSMLLNHSNSFVYQVPIIPKQLPFDKNIINNFWEAISDDYLFLLNTANANNL